MNPDTFDQTPQHQSYPHSNGMSRRNFIRNGIGALAVPMVGGCLGCSTGILDPNGSESAARLTARPGTPTESPTLGLSELGLGGERDGILYVPSDYSDDNTYPLFIGLHGAGGDADNWNGSYPGRAQTRGMIFVAPDSRNSSWDLVTYPDRTFGVDVVFINEVLNHVFTRCRIDPSRIALGGFSDGASYALSLGIGNGDLFTHLVAYSPGFCVIPDPVVGQPAVFVSHGPHDAVLPFYNTANSIVPALEDAGYDVTFHEFDGGHEVPSEVSDIALDWFLG
jgi:phospholipase/carboxylesterase